MRLLTLGLALITVAAHASFDLILVADNTGNFTGPTTSKIHRYDGDSGVYLGSFQTDFGNIDDLAVDGAANEAFVASGGRIKVYNIGTGAVKRVFTVGTTNALRMHNGTLYRSVGNVLTTMNKATGAQSTVKAWTNPISDFGISSNGSYILYDKATAFIQGFSSAGVAGSSFTSPVIAPGNGHIAFDGGAPDFFYLMGNDSGGVTARVHASSINASGTFSVSTTGFSTTFMNTYVDHTASHLGFWVFGENQAGNQALFRMNTGMGNGGDRVILTPQVTNAGQIAVVLAPEPGTFLAVGVGVAALLRRRKK